MDKGTRLPILRLQQLVNLGQVVPGYCRKEMVLKVIVQVHVQEGEQLVAGDRSGLRKRVARTGMHMLGPTPEIGKERRDDARNNPVVKHTRPKAKA